MKITFFSIKIGFILALVSSCSLFKQEHWSYDDMDRWGTKYSKCADPEFMSPINFTRKDIKEKLPIKFKLHYPLSRVVIDKNESQKGLRLNYLPKGYIVWDEIKYRLQHIEVRSPSEHEFEGQSFPLEVQFYHKEPTSGLYLMLSVFVKKGKRSEVWQQIIENFVNAEFSEVLPFSTDLEYTPKVLLPSKKGLYFYWGSLTHPPCDNFVRWGIFKNPIELDGQQIDNLLNSVSTPRRPIQASGRREIVEFY